MAQSTTGTGSRQAPGTLQRVGIVALLTLVAIAIHESGHFIVYKLGGYPVRVSLQSVRPIGPVDPRWNTVALAAGPAMSVAAALLFLCLARRHQYGFAWVTAAFTNASLRTFPCTMDLVRALQGAHPFSDEGDVILAFTAATAQRTIAVGILLVAYVSLTIVVGRRYDFTRYRGLKTAGVYLLSLAVGITVVIVDELLHHGA